MKNKTSASSLDLLHSVLSVPPLNCIALQILHFGIKCNLYVNKNLYLTRNDPKTNTYIGVCVCVCARYGLSHVSYLIDVLVSFDEVNREFPQWGAGRVSETRGDPPLEYGHIRQHLQRTATLHTHVSTFSLIVFQQGWDNNTISICQDTITSDFKYSHYLKTEKQCISSNSYLTVHLCTNKVCAKLKKN